MKFIIDENLPPKLATWLRQQGHEAEHVLRIFGPGASDSDIARLARSDGMTIITRDADFDALADISVKVLRLRTAALLIEWLAPKLDGAINQFSTGPVVVLGD